MRPAVHADHRHRSAVGAGEDGLAQRDRAVGLHAHELLHAVVHVQHAVGVAFHAHRVDAGVGAATRREVLA